MKSCALLLFLLVFSAGVAQKHSILGRWKTIDDESGKAVSIVEIYESKGKIYGRVAELLIASDRNKTCSKCEGSDKDKPVLGLVVIKGLKREDGVYKGRILDPKHGRVYQCTLQLESKDKLKVRGYIGISLLGRTQYWHRVK
jgi:uncharacterized protein (DUF2147 family)